MKSNKGFLLPLVFVLSTMGSAPAHAGIPVIDVSNLLQSILQVFSWIEQAEQMITQIKQIETEIKHAETTIKNVTGGRGYGNIPNDLGLREVVPDDMMDLYTLINSDGYEGLSSAAKKIRAKQKIYGCEKQKGLYKQACDANLSINAQNLANQANALELLKGRMDQIQELQLQIDTTTDPKGIAELQARIEAESTQVSNDANRIEIMNAMAASQTRAIEQQLKELELANLAAESDGTDTFSFVLP